MDRDTVANHIENLSKAKFDNVARLVLTQVFGLQVVDTDRKGDDGFDYLPLKMGGGSQAMAIQRTVQERGWKEKAASDADKAVKQGALGFYFLTSRLREISELRELEQAISSKHGIPATCLGGYEIADLLLQRDLLFDFATVINLPLEVPKNLVPDTAVQALHAYVALSSDRQSLRDKVYEDSILLALEFEGNQAPRDKVVEEAQHFLGCPDVRLANLRGRIDSMLTRGMLESAPPNIALSKGVRRQLTVANALYLGEMRDLASAQASILHEECRQKWDAEQSEQAALAITKWFIVEQLETAEKSSLPLAKTGLVRRLGNPESDLREMLRTAGVGPQKMNTVLARFVDVARETPLMKKLTTAAMYVALEGSDSATAAPALGAASWQQIPTTLDASVAIPYICECLFGPTIGRFSRGVSECMNVFRRVGTPMRIPWCYINECAAHLLRALEYENSKDDFAVDLAYSQNAFVAYYFQLRRSGVSVPPTLKQFVAEFSARASAPAQDRRNLTQRVMGELQPLFRRYRVEHEDIPHLNSSHLRDVEVEYTYRLKELNRSKSAQLVRHDVEVLAHQRRQISEHGEVRCFLTWDAALIAVARNLKDCGWVVSPVDAADLVQPSLALSGRKLAVMAHALARVQERPAEAAARMVDRIIDLAGNRMAEWEFRRKVRAFRDEAMSRIDLSHQNYFNQVDMETDRFLQGEGIGPAADSLETTAADDA